MKNNDESVVLTAYAEHTDTIDKKKVDNITIRVIELEKENANTKDNNDHEMKKKIAKIIEEEVSCY